MEYIHLAFLSKFQPRILSSLLRREKVLSPTLPTRGGLEQYDSREGWPGAARNAALQGVGAVKSEEEKAQAYS